MMTTPGLALRCAKSRLAQQAPIFLQRRLLSSLPVDIPFLHISEEVQAAVQARQPVVALETTIYTHGFPHPQNVALAAELEHIVREGGAVPATIGILDGVARVGMLPSELERLTDPNTNVEVLKISRRDLAFAIGTRLAGRTFHGGTTIAGTSVLAQLAGIRIFATGGLGGVHRGAESSMDVSADLTELGRTPITVISSGCKSFLDIPRTMEYLETEGVTVATFADGRDGSVDFPAFWARDSGVKSPMTLRDEREAAAVVHAQTSLALTSGMLFANPIPANAAIAKTEMDVIIAEAVRVANEKGVTGKDNTPFILDWIVKATEGRSIVANRALVSSNVRRGTRVAVELAKLEGAPEIRSCRAETLHAQSGTVTSDDVTSLNAANVRATLTASRHGSADVVVAGAVAVDVSCDYAPFDNDGSHQPRLHTSNPAVVRQTLGGVGYNITKTLHYLGVPVTFCSVVGDDLSGSAVREAMEREGLDLHSVNVRTSASTAQYVAINDRNKGLHLAMADMTICEQDDDKNADLRRVWEDRVAGSSATWAVLDANFTSSTLGKLADTAKQHGLKTALEPVSAAKSARSLVAFQHHDPDNRVHWRFWPRHLFDIVTPNSMELATMYTRADSLGAFEDKVWFRVLDALGIPSTGITKAFKQLMPSHLVEQGIPQKAIKLLPLMPCIVTKLGPDGVLVAQLLTQDDPRLRDGVAAPFILGRGVIGSASFSNISDAGSESIVGGVYMRHFPVTETVPDTDVVSVNGVGDTFLGTIIAGLVKKGDGNGVEDFVGVAQQAAALTLKSKESVSPAIEELRTRL